MVPRRQNRARDGREFAPAERRRHPERIARDRAMKIERRHRSLRACAQARHRRRRCRGRPSARRLRQAMPRTASPPSSCWRCPSRPTASRSLSGGTVRYPMSTAVRNSSISIAGAAVKSRVGRSSSIGTTRRSAPAKPGDLVDGRTADCEIRHHLCGDRLRIGRDAARRDAMIAGKDRNGDALEPRNFAALPARQPYGKLFETAKASRRLCQRLLPARRRPRPTDASPSGKSRQKARISSRLSNCMRFPYLRARRDSFGILYHE